MNHRLPEWALDRGPSQFDESSREHGLVAVIFVPNLFEPIREMSAMYHGANFGSDYKIG